jgi:predicted lysophospholipase L1 biosynthesis ABC-type transport system permease subunit
MTRWQARLARFWRIAPAYLQMVARREWQLAVLALGGLAPGVAAITAWLHLAWRMRSEPQTHSLRGWLLPATLVEMLGPQGVLVGAGVVTLLIGCLGLANVYLASVERRMGELGLLMGLGLNRRETAILLLLEVLAIGLLGSAVGVGLGVLLSGLSWISASAYFSLAAGRVLAGPVLLTSLAVGVLAALLFMGLSALVVTFELPSLTLRGGHRSELLDAWQEWRTTITGTLFAGLLALAAGLSVLNTQATLALTGLTLALSAGLSLGGWLLTRLYWRLPKPEQTPLWALAVQGLARHPRHTAGMTLALTTGAYSVGLAALTWLDGAAASFFPFWVAGLVLIAGASLVLTAASLAALERRHEYGLLMALGARARRVWELILLEYAIVAVGGGALGALMALGNWVLSRGQGEWWMAIAIVLADLLGALGAAWAGAAPVLWLVTRRSQAVALRNERG